MKLKSITFRCSEAQLSRLESAMLTTSTDNRTAFISQALDSFLSFAEQDDIKKLNLFELVEHVDETQNSIPFAQQA